MVEGLTIPGLEIVEAKGRARGELMALCLSGSHAYGMNHEDSDFDLQGVYRSPTSQNLLLWGRPKETIHEANKCLDCGGHYKQDDMDACPACGCTSIRPDYTIHELFKFFYLASQGNPTVLEVMYLTPIVSSPAWQLIVENREAFLSSAVRRSYGGYAKQQLAKKRKREAEGMEGYSPKTRYRDTKHTRHIGRLFIQEQQLLETGVITPMLTPEQIEVLRELETWDSDTLKLWMDKQENILSDIQSGLPALPDTERINELLLTLRGL